MSCKLPPGSISRTLALLACVVAGAACSHVDRLVESRIERVLTKEWTETRADGRLDVVATRVSSEREGALVKVRVFRKNHCADVKYSAYRVRRVEEHEARRLWGDLFFGGALGTVSTVATVGLVGDRPLDWNDDQRARRDVAVGAGALASVFLLNALSTAIQSIDDKVELPDDKKESVGPDRVCSESPLADREVEAVVLYFEEGRWREVIGKTSVGATDGDGMLAVDLTSLLGPKLPIHDGDLQVTLVIGREEVGRFRPFALGEKE